MSSKETHQKILRIEKYNNNIKPLLEQTGATLISFDPGYTIRWENQTIHLPYDFVTKLNNMIKKRRIESCPKCKCVEIEICTAGNKRCVYCGYFWNDKK